MSETQDLSGSRAEKLRRIEALGLDPWGQRFDGHQPIAALRTLPLDEANPPTVRAAGRIVLRRGAGKLQFLEIRDWSGQRCRRELKSKDSAGETVDGWSSYIQVMIGQKQVGETGWALTQELDLGDLLGVDGKLGKTKTGELTIFAEKLHYLGKSLLPHPDKWGGMQEMELRLRHRYLDLLYSPETLERTLNRIKIVRTIRNHLNAQGYCEVETPTLHAIAGGAAARPFTTHHNALDIDLYLRIALELHLKRLLVGGIEKVYEIGRVFRNEGISQRHNPEFTMLELYQAYGNYETMMDLTEGLIVACVDCLASTPTRSASEGAPTPTRSASEGAPTPTRSASEGAPTPTRSASEGAPTPTRSASEGASTTRQLPWGEKTINFAPPFQRSKYADLFQEFVGVAMDDVAGVEGAAQAMGLTTQGKHHDVLVHHLFEEKVEHRLVGPVFVYDYPAALCPLTKRKRGQPSVAERFELYVHGMELANAYTELNDPVTQEATFRQQLAGLKEEDSMAKMDDDFVRALRHGMPPAGGLGIGIDRLVMLLTNTQSIRDVILFPLLRPEK